MNQDNPVWSINQSLYGETFEKSKTPSLQWGLVENTPINKMPVKIGDKNDRAL